MKVKDRVCDICGESVYRLRGYSAYKILKYDWWVDLFPKKVDLCQNCYRGLERYIKNYNLYGENEMESSE